MIVPEVSQLAAKMVNSRSYRSLSDEEQTQFIRDAVKMKSADELSRKYPLLVSDIYNTNMKRHKSLSISSLREHVSQLSDLPKDEQISRFAHYLISEGYHFRTDGERFVVLGKGPGRGWWGPPKGSHVPKVQYLSPSVRQRDRLLKTMQWDSELTNEEEARNRIAQYMDQIPDSVALQSSLKQVYVAEDVEDIGDRLRKVAPEEAYVLDEGEVVNGFYNRETGAAAVTMWSSMDMDYSGRNFFHEYAHSLEGIITSNAWEKAWFEWPGGQDEGFADAFAEWMTGKLAGDTETRDWFREYRPETSEMFVDMGLDYG